MAIDQSNYAHAMAEDPETGKPMQKVKVEGLESNSMNPYDHQATLTSTLVTHTSTAVAPSTSNAQSTWQLVPEGMTDFVNNLTADSGVANLYTNVYWSEDGTNISGKTAITVSNTLAQSQKTSTNWFAVGGSFYKVEVTNGDATPKTCSANIKFRP